MTRGGRAKDRSEPERRCIATGEVRPKAALIRFVLAPDGHIVPDLAAKLPGRGLWVSADRAALDRVERKGLFARAARQPVQLAPALADRIEATLAARVVELVSLSRKAGLAVCGYEKTKDWLVTERAVVLLQASDGSARGKTRLRAPAGPDGYVGCLTASELGLAFGREHVIHGALAAGGLTARVVEEAARLSGLRKMIGGQDAGKDTKSI